MTIRARKRLSTEDGDKLEVLVTLVELYEAKRWPVETESFDPIDALRYSIAELGHTQAELGELLGSRARASETLSPAGAHSRYDPQDQRRVENYG
jgi:antitoxin component HigA of HigAB toxin-antitoxin module